MEAKARLFLNAERDKLYPEGHPKGAFLYAAPGDEIPEDAAKQFGLVDGDLPKRGQTDEEKAAKKAEADKAAAEKAEAKKAAAEKTAADKAASKAEGGAAAKAEGK